MKECLPASAASVRLDERYFDTRGLDPISPKLRREVAKLADRAAVLSAENGIEHSEPVLHSLVVPAVKLSSGINPVGRSFQLMVANISRDGIDLVHNEPIEAEHIAIKLTLVDKEPIQVVVRLIRERELQPPLREFGGEFSLRLGSAAAEEDEISTHFLDEEFSMPDYLEQQ